MSIREAFTAPPGDAALNLREEFRNLPVGGRVAATLLLFLGAFGGLTGGYFLLHETRHWASWATALLILEPIGIFSVLALFTLAVPDSALATFLSGALKRASLAVALFLLGYVGLVGALIIWAVVAWARG
jgi:hypothetical protein